MPSDALPSDAVPSDAAVVAARRTLHAVAEHLLAGPQWRHAREISLVVTAGGFATPVPARARPRRARAHRDQVAARPAGPAAPLAGSVRAMAAVLGVTPGAPDGLYGEHAELGPDDELVVDAAAIAAVLGAFSAGATALGELARGTGHSTETPVLWPEHFDVGISLDEVNYGLSPGDAAHARPYAYVGPWTPRTGAFWNEPFGAVASRGRPGRRRRASSPSSKRAGHCRRDPDPAAT
jgi:hypothetical protein